MKTLIKILKSKTVWTIVFMVAFNLIQATSNYIPSDLYILINSVLGALAVYFKITPSQKY